MRKIKLLSGLLLLTTSAFARPDLTPVSGTVSEIGTYLKVKTDRSGKETTEPMEFVVLTLKKGDGSPVILYLDRNDTAALSIVLAARRPDTLNFTYSTRLVEIGGVLQNGNIVQTVVLKSSAE